MINITPMPEGQQFEDAYCQGGCDDDGLKSLRSLNFEVGLYGGGIEGIRVFLCDDCLKETATKIGALTL